MSAPPSSIAGIACFCIRSVHPENRGIVFIYFGNIRLMRINLNVGFVSFWFPFFKSICAYLLSFTSNFSLETTKKTAAPIMSAPVMQRITVPTPPAVGSRDTNPVCNLNRINAIFIGFCIYKTNLCDFFYNIIFKGRLCFNKIAVPSCQKRIGEDCMRLCVVKRYFIA